MRRAAGWAAAIVVALALPAVYIGSVVLANWLTSTFGQVGVGLGLQATAGTVAIGGAIMTRDLLQDVYGRVAVLAAIVVAAAASWLLAAPRIAVASGLTFLIAELVETVVYSPLRRRAGFASGRWAGVVGAANVTGAVVDTFLFLALAGFPLTAAGVGGQLVGKAWVTLGVVALVVGGRRAVFREPVNA